MDEQLIVKWLETKLLEFRNPTYAAGFVGFGMLQIMMCRAIHPLLMFLLQKGQGLQHGG